MKGWIIKVVLLLVVGIIGYNYFFGSAEEKANAQQIVGQVQKLTHSVADLLKSEKEKFDEGKYDDAIAKIKSALNTMHEKIATFTSGGDANLLRDVESLEQQELNLETRLHNLDPNDVEGAHAIRDQILELNRQTESLASRFGP